MQVDRYKIHDIEVVIDRLAVTRHEGTPQPKRSAITPGTGKDLMFVLVNDEDKKVFNTASN